MIKKIPFFSSQKNKKKAIIAIIFISLFILFALFVGFSLVRFFSNVSQSKEFILGFGVYAPIIFIGLQLTQIMLAIIPATPLILVSGYIFGSYLGSLYSLIGITIGSFFTFYLAKKLGRPFVETIVHKKHINKFDNIEETNLTMTLFILFLLPAIPNDVFCYVAGLTKLSYKKYFLALAFGRYPMVIFLSFLGFQISKLSGVMTVIAIILLILLSTILLVNRHKISKHLTSGVKRIQKHKK